MGFYPPAKIALLQYFQGSHSAFKADAISVLHQSDIRDLYWPEGKMKLGKP